MVTATIGSSASGVQTLPIVVRRGVRTGGAERSRTACPVSGSTGVHNVRTLRPVKRPRGRQNAAALVRPRDGFGTRRHCVQWWRAAIRGRRRGGLGATTTPTTAANSVCKTAVPKATEIGVTASTITVTVIADVNNSIRPGLFKGSWDGMKAWGDYITRPGGLACRKVVVKEGRLQAEPDRRRERGRGGVRRLDRDGRHRPRCSCKTSPP